MFHIEQSNINVIINILFRKSVIRSTKLPANKQLSFGIFIEKKKYSIFVLQISKKKILHMYEM